MKYPDDEMNPWLFEISNAAFLIKSFYDRSTHQDVLFSNSVLKKSWELPVA